MSLKENDIYIERLEADLRADIRETRNHPGIPLEYLAQMLREELGETDCKALLKELS